MILLDTHVLIWLALEPTRISKNARTAIDGARHNGSGIAISSITLLEVARLSRLGRIHFPAGVETFLSDVESRFRIFPITAHVAVQAMALPASYPKDPSDQVIGATALIEDLPLITSDREIRRSKAVPAIW